MAATITFRPDEKATAQITDLLSLYPNQNQMVLAAIDALHEIHFPTKHPSPPYVMEYASVRLAAAAVCAETGKELPAGTEAYREVWSDGRPGALLSLEAIEE